MYHELTLAPGDAIRVGPDVRLTAVRGHSTAGNARVGVETPRAVPITRPEVDPGRHARPDAKEATP